MMKLSSNFSQPADQQNHGQDTTQTYILETENELLELQMGKIGEGRRVKAERQSMKDELMCCTGVWEKRKYSEEVQ
jgi:hypothetical protein